MAHDSSDRHVDTATGALRPIDGRGGLNSERRMEGNMLTRRWLRTVPAAVLVTVMAACVPPPGPTGDPTGLTPGECLDTAAADMIYLGPATASPNVQVFGSSDGTCSSSAGQGVATLVFVSPDDPDAATAACQGWNGDWTAGSSWSIPGAKAGTYICGGSLSAVPVLADVSPSSGPEEGGTQVGIEGAHFAGATAVYFGDKPAASFEVVSDTMITAETPAGTGEVSVQVVTPAGTSAALATFTYVATPAGDAPTVTGLAPMYGPEAGGTEVTITGTDFTGATAVYFGDRPAVSFEVVSDTEINAVAPSWSSPSARAATSGAGDATANLMGGEETLFYVRVVTSQGESPQAEAVSFVVVWTPGPNDPIGVTPGQCQTSTLFQHDQIYTGRGSASPNLISFVSNDGSCSGGVLAPYTLVYVDSDHSSATADAAVAVTMCEAWDPNWTRAINASYPFWILPESPLGTYLCLPS